MMKKILVAYVVFGLALLVSVNVVNGMMNDGLSEEEIMNEYIVDNYGEQCYGVLLDDNDDECIEFSVFENGFGRYYVSINKDYYQDYYNE